MYILKGEYETTCNGFYSVVLFEIEFKTKQEAEKGKEDREYRYKNMKIIKKGKSEDA